MVPGGASIDGEPAAITRLTAATLTVGGPGDHALQVSRQQRRRGAREDPVAHAHPTRRPDRRHLHRLCHGQERGRRVGRARRATASKTWTVNTACAARAHQRGAGGQQRGGRRGTPTRPDRVVQRRRRADRPVGHGHQRRSGRPRQVRLPRRHDAGSRTSIWCSTPTTTPAPGPAPGLQARRRRRRRLPVRHRPPNGSTLLDSVEYGPQVADLSIGRVGHDGAWTLTQPTFGAANVAARTGNPATLKINEWFTNGQVRLTDDFIELYNPDPLPVPLVGLSLTDNPIVPAGQEPDRRR